MTPAAPQWLPKSWAERRRATIAWLLLGPFLILAACGPPLVEPRSWTATVMRIVAWSMFLAGTGFRFWATLYIGGRKGQSVVCDGPYSVCRNPLYFGTVLIGVSVGLHAPSLALMVGLALSGVAYFSAAVTSEERRLLAKHSAQYAEYCRRVPRFWPRWGLLYTPATIDIDLRCLGIECVRSLRWLCLPLAAEAAVRLF
jgi:protein-S-isoprenylcysteine O-methyltransferase Ste14